MFFQVFQKNIKVSMKLVVKYLRIFDNGMVTKCEELIVSQTNHLKKSLDVEYSLKMNRASDTIEVTYSF